MSVGALWPSCCLVIGSDDGQFGCHAVPEFAHDQQPVERVPWTHTYEIVQQNTVIRRAPKLGGKHAGPVSDRLDEHGLIG